MMKVLVLGATGYVGARLCTLLQGSGWAQAVPASSRGGGAALRLDARDRPAMTAALEEVDAVVNCVAGSASAIRQGAAVLAAAARATGCPRIVHLSTQSVYGAQEGMLAEATPPGPALGWYGRAKVEAEAQLTALREHASLTVLRPGCVFGPHSWLWVERIARWLLSGRLGDLGAAGDGWSNLVHVDDVCQAVLLSLRRPAHAGVVHCYNLAAPDSPRWNDYFADLALAIEATPLRRVRLRQLQLDAYLAGPPLQLARRLAARLGRDANALAPPITPGLLDLWQRQLKLDSAAASGLGLRWMPYAHAVQQCASWVLARDGWPLWGENAPDAKSARMAQR